MRDISSLREVILLCGGVDLLWKTLRSLKQNRKLRKRQLQLHSCVIQTGLFGLNQFRRKKMGLGNVGKKGSAESKQSAFEAALLKLSEGKGHEVFEDPTIKKKGKKKDSEEEEEEE
jgi:hypothetical protein